MGRGRLLAVAAVAAAVLGGPADEARGQVSVHRDDGVFEYTMTVNQLVYGLIDTVKVTYSARNMTNSTQSLRKTGCGVEFFAVRDSMCTFGGEDCEIAGCDACPICFEGDGCSFDPCSPVSIGPDSTFVRRWDWPRDVCPGDFGSDLLFGNVGTFRLVTGYHVCDNGGYQNMLEINITVLKQIATFPATWGSLKSRYGGAADRVRPPG